MRTSGTGRVQNKGLSSGPKRHIWRVFPQWRPVEPSPVQGAEASQPPASHFSLSTPSCHLSPLGVSARPVTTQFGGAGSSPGPRRASGGSATGLGLEKSRLSLRLLSPGIPSSQAHIHPTIQGTAKGPIRGGGFAFSRREHRQELPGRAQLCPLGLRATGTLEPGPKGSARASSRLPSLQPLEAAGAEPGTARQRQPGRGGLFLSRQRQAPSPAEPAPPS